MPNPVPILPVIPPDVTLTQQEGGFIPQDFAIFRVLGRLTMKEVRSQHAQPQQHHIAGPIYAAPILHPCALHLAHSHGAAGTS